MSNLSCIFVPKFNINMSTETTAAAQKQYWLYFGVSLVAMLAFLVIKPEWFWVVLPFVCTFFVKGMDWL